MLLNKPRMLSALLVLSLVLAGCGQPAPAASSPTPQPDTVLTSAAQTAEAQLTNQAQPTSTATETSVPTSAATTGAPPELLTGTPPGTPPGTPLVGFTPTVPAGGSPSGDLAVFSADITIPDGTNLDPGEAFTKTWRLSNGGTTTWTTDYAMVFIGGAQMSGPGEVPLSKQVAPGETIDISVNLVAPQEGGNHRGFWQLRNAAGELFQTAFYVDINVGGGTPGAPGPTSTPAPGGNAQVSQISLTVDETSADECPHTFAFTGLFTLNKPATVTYILEAGTDTAGFTFDLPGEQNQTLTAGSHQVTYTLLVQDTVNGWAVLKFSAPNTAESGQVNFSLDCGS